MKHMLDVELIRKEPEKIRQGIAKKNADPKLVDQFLERDSAWKSAVSRGDIARASLNLISEKIGKTKEKTGPEFEKLKADAKEIKENIKKAEDEVANVEAERMRLLRMLPNPPLDHVITGKDETFNKTLREVGDKPKFDFPVQDYVTLGEKLDLIDTVRAGKVSGSRFGYLKHEAPLLEFALVQMALNFLTSEKEIAKLIKEKKLNIKPKAFIPVIPPVLVKPESMQAMGYVERGGDEIYHLDKDDLYLVGTSEQSIGPMHMNESFQREALPHRHIGFSTCFRREAGSYGKDTKGILRVHQFDKLEMFVTCTPETSGDEHQLLLAIEEKMMQLLKLPYRVLDIASGDLGDPAAAKYDIEAWLPGQMEGKGQYRETHSTSNTTDYQARRLSIKIKPDNTPAHLLNGTCFAIGRILIAIIENYQTKKGTVKVPKALQKYVNFKEISR